MKISIKGILVALAIILIAFSANAKSAKGDLITNKGYDYVVNPNNADVVLYPGMTCGEWTKVLRRFTMAKFGKSLEEVRSGSTVADKAAGHNYYNTYLLNGRAQAFGPVKEIEKNVLVYNGQEWLVLQCAQMISTDAGLINNAINGTADLTPIGYKIPETPEKEKENQKEESMRHDVYHHMDGAMQGIGAPGAGVTESQTPWGWIIFAIIAILAIVAFIVMYLDGSRNRRDRIHRELTDFRRDNIREHYNEVDQFLNTARKMNTDAAHNMANVHNTMNMYARNGQAPAQPPTGGQGQ